MNRVGEADSVQILTEQEESLVHCEFMRGYLL